MSNNSIEVKKTSGERYEVTVKSDTTTRHEVTLTNEYFEKLTGGNITPEQLIERSFEFLLGREPNTAILSSFELPVIGQYFPDYEESIAGKAREK